MTKTDPRKGAGHRKRLRDRFLSAGLDGFHDYEVVELLLTLSTPRKDCKDAAKAALAKFKSLPVIFEATAQQLGEVDGVGPKNIFGIKLIKAVADRYLKAKMQDRQLLANSSDLFNYLYHNMRDRAVEVFKVLFLNAKNRLIAAETLFEGTLAASAVYPREVVAAAIRHQAAALIFSHNHPSGDPAPSPEDYAVTRRLVFACRLMEMTVHDHLIIGDNRYFSFADQGEIARINRSYDGIAETLDARKMPETEKIDGETG